MATAKIQYQGNLRTEATHLKSSSTLITDAPTDNNGKGEAFSPTDLVATALSSCMITIMGIKARDKGIDITGIKSEMTKVMASSPRRISEIIVTLRMPPVDISDSDKKLLEAVAKACPVAQSIHPDIKQTISFFW